MILTTVLLILSVITSGLIYYFSSLWMAWYWFWVPLILVPLIFILLCVVHILNLAIMSLFVSKKKEQTKPSKLFTWEINQTVWLIILLSNTKINVSGLDKLPKGSRYLLVSNHISNFDQFCVIAKLPKEQFIFVTKPENMEIPIAGAFMHKAGFIPIDRNDNFEGLKAILKAVKVIENNVGSISISPEGTRSKSLILLPFHPGSFKIATKTKSPIVVISIQNTNLILKRFFFRHTNVYLDVLKTIEYEEYKDKNTIQIAHEVEDLIKFHQQKSKGRRI